MDRVSAAELIDQPDASRERLAESFEDLARLNRYLGGAATIAHQWRLLSNGRFSGDLRVLDVGAGGGDILVALARWLDARRLRMTGVALDRGSGAVELAARRLATSSFADRLAVVRGDALDLPFADGVFHFVYCSTFLHHFSERDAVAVLREMARVTKLGLVVSDLRRSRAAYAAARFMAATLWRGHPCTRHDGPVSVRAAYTPAEARRLAERAGLADRAGALTVEAQPFFRWALRWRRG